MISQGQSGQQDSKNSLLGLMFKCFNQEPQLLKLFESLVLDLLALLEICLIAWVLITNSNLFSFHVSTALSIIYDQFIREPTAATELARREYMQMKCCSL